MKVKIKDIQVNNHPFYWKILFGKCAVKILPIADTTKWQTFKSESLDIAISNLMISIIFNTHAQKNPTTIAGLKGKGIKYFVPSNIIIYLDRFPFEFTDINGGKKVIFKATYRAKLQEGGK